MRKLLHNMVCCVNHIWPRESANKENHERYVYTRKPQNLSGVMCSFLYETFTFKCETLNSFLSHKLFFKIPNPSDGKPAEGSQPPSVSGPHSCLSLSYDSGHFPFSLCVSLISNKIITTVKCSKAVYYLKGALYLTPPEISNPPHPSIHILHYGATSIQHSDTRYFLYKLS